MNKQIKKIFFVLGGPGSGKGTFCENFIEKNKFANHYSAGQLLRNFMHKNQNTKDPENKKIYNQVIKTINAGQIVPARITTSLILKNIEVDKNGFPRNQDNYKYWQKQNQNTIENYAVFLNCTEKTLYNRIINRKKNAAQQRTDDTDDIFQLRLQTFRDQTLPIIDKYRLQNKLIELNAEQEPQKIVEDFENIYPKLFSQIIIYINKYKQIIQKLILSELF